MSARIFFLHTHAPTPPLSFCHLSVSLSDSLRPSAHSLCCLYGGGASWGSVGLTGHEHVRGNGKRMEKEGFGEVHAFLSLWTCVFECVCACVMQVKQICSYSAKDSIVEAKHGLILRSGFYSFLKVTFSFIMFEGYNSPQNQKKNIILLIKLSLF